MWLSCLTAYGVRMQADNDINVNHSLLSYILIQYQLDSDDVAATECGCVVYTVVQHSSPFYLLLL